MSCGNKQDRIRRLEYMFNGPLRRNPKNPRYFTDDSGNAIYLTGSHTWSVMQDMWLENEPVHRMDYPGFLQMMKDNNHNFLRFWQWMQVKNAPWNSISTCFDPQPFARTGPGVANDGLPKFNLDSWNDSYFARLRERVELACSKGIYVSIMLFEGWGIKWATDETDPWMYHPMNPANNVNGIKDNPIVENGRAWDFYSLNCPELLHYQKQYVKKVIDSISDLDNVLLEICNEVPFRKEAFDWSNHMVGFIKEYQQQIGRLHPVGITAEGGDQDNGILFESSADWISPSNGRLFEYRYNPPAADGTKVVLNDTDHLWGHGCETAWIWKSFCRGMNVLFMDPWEPIHGDYDWWHEGSVTKNQRYFYAWDPMRRNLGYTRYFADRMDLNSCRPMGELATSTYCLANPGKEYLIFYPAGGSEGIDLLEAPGMYNVEWFNPLKGMTIKAEQIRGGQRQAMTAPFDGQAVLYLYRESE